MKIKLETKPTKRNQRQARNTNRYYLPSLRCYYLKVKLNNKVVKMKIDSGCHNSIINLKVWRALGSPKLKPCKAKRFGSSGAEVIIIGYFIVKVSYLGRSFDLPIQVSGKEDTRNLIGRRWFPILNLNWNRIFHRECLPYIPRFRQADEIPMLPADFLKEVRTKHFYVTIFVNGVKIRILFDSGATHTKIGIIEWERLGCPTLEPCNMTILDTANQPLDIKGQLRVNVRYKGEEHRQLLLVVMNKRGNNKCILGTNWYRCIKFDFNKIFSNITCVKPKVKASELDQ